MVNYECLRCHYNSKDKRTMRIHLFGRKQCEGIYSQLDLTDEIRDNILTYGTYQENNLLKNINTIENGYIYIVHTRGCIDCKNNVYKIGKTKDYEKRIKGYAKGSIYKLIVEVENYHQTEKTLLKLCRETLIERRDYGCEYFETIANTLRNIIVDNCNIVKSILDTTIKQRNRKSKPPYECPRCDYTSVEKTNMRRHLYGLKKQCQAIRNDIELTDEIKDKILENRIYHIPKHKHSKKH